MTGRPKAEYGVGATGMTAQVYGFVIRMIADGHKNAPIRRAVEKFFPDEPVPTSDRLRNLRIKRKPEITALRERLSASFDDMWIARKRQRLEALEQIFEDANRWSPKRAIELALTNQQRQLMNADPSSLTEKEKALREKLLEAPRSVLVYEKDTGTMMQALKAAQSELGEDSGSKAAQSLEDLVRLAEGARGLTQTVDATVELDDSVPTLLEAEIAETPMLYPSAGDDSKHGLLDGSTEPGSALLELARGADGAESPEEP